MKQPEQNKANNYERLPEIVVPLLQWYDSYARVLPWRATPDPYAIWISEIMLQQTRVEAVIPYFNRWMKALPDLKALADAAEEEVLKLWEGLGYYSRVRNIHKTAKIVLEKYGGNLPASFEELRSLPGIGEYTAGSVGSIAFQLAVPCVDGNVLRVVTRLAADGADIGAVSTKKLLTELVKQIIPPDRPGDFNQSLMELGATVCLPNGLPKCEICPVAFLCEAKKHNRVTEFPVKAGKPARKIEKKTVLILLDSTAPGACCKTALRKREETGLLSGLWEFPNLNGYYTEEEIRQLLTSSGLKLASIVKLDKAKHIFSHIEWDMIGYLAAVETDAPAEAAAEPDAPAEAVAELAVPAEATAEDAAQYGTLSGFLWIDVELLDKQLALPTAFKPYYQIMKRCITEGVTE